MTFLKRDASLPRRAVHFLLTAVTAFLVSASFPPLDIGVFAWFGLSPLLFALRQRGSLEATISGFQFACLFAIGTFYWTYNVIGINVADFSLFLLVFSLYFSVFGFLYRLMSRRCGAWIILGAPSLWVALEYVRSNLFFLSWPWNLLGHSQHSYLPVIQIADITGVYGISFLIVLVNQFLSQLPEFFSMRRAVSINGTTSRRYGKGLILHFVTVALLLILTFAYGLYNLSKHSDSRHLRVALVQANVITEDNMPFASQVEHLRVYEKLTRDAAVSKPDLIAWPDSSLPAPISSRLVRSTIVELTKETGSYLLVGGAGHEKTKPKKEGYRSYSNSEFLITPSGLIAGQYNKTRLLPFNEFLPLQGIIRWPQWITSLEESFIPGEEYTLFQVSGARFGTPICWENLFPDLYRQFVKEGAHFMVSVTNEGFLVNTTAHYQTLAMNIFRAVENRVAIVRVSPNGVSGFINPDGEVIKRVRESNGNDIFVSGVLIGDVPLSNKKTFYTIYGDIFAYATICVAALTILASVFTRKKNNMCI
jgi:apolipoprotein N-acyltransferase